MPPVSPVAGDDLALALGGDSRAFERMVEPHLGRVRALACRMLGNPDDAADVQQETLLRAFRQLSTFRGEAALSTWLLHIATNLCLDTLRSRGRWRVEAQPMAKEDCMAGESSLHRDLMATVSDPGFAFDVREHIAFCFTCVARTLDAETEVALVLSELFDVADRDAAALLGMSESVYRHRLSEARRNMEHAFEGLCSLVNKAGACYQCSELRDLTPQARRGREVPSLGEHEERWRRRLAIVRDADLVGGRSRALHDLLFRWIADKGRAFGPAARV